MPVIVVACPKGGVGKSTTSILLSSEIAHLGYEVCLVDADPNSSASIWDHVSTEKRTRVDNLTVVPERDEGSIVRTIREHEGDNRFVVIDCEGISSRLVARAISQADLVVTPLKARVLDAKVASSARQLIAEEEEVLRTKIPHVMVLTMTSGVRTKEAKAVEALLAGQGAELIKPDLMERVPYSAIHTYGGGVRQGPPHPGKEKAIREAEGFAAAVLDRLAAEHAQEAAQ